MSDRVSLVIAGRGLDLDVGNGIVDGVRAEIPSDYPCDVEVTEWSRQPGSHYSVRMSSDLVQMLSQQVASGARAVVVFCGSATIEEMAYLAGLLWIYPQPLIFAAMPTTGSPMSESQLAVRDALAIAASHGAWNNGVLVYADGRIYSAMDVMLASNMERIRMSGNLCSALGAVVGGEVAFMHKPVLKGRVFNEIVSPAKNVEMIYATLGGGKVFLQALVDDNKGSVDGLVIAGFGSGSVYPSWVPCIKTLAFKDVPIVLASRCLRGNVLDSGDFEGSFLRLKELGIMSGGYLSPLQARLKLAVGIGAGLRGAALQDYILH